MRKTNLIRAKSCSKPEPLRPTPAPQDTGFTTPSCWALQQQTAHTGQSADITCNRALPPLSPCPHLQLQWIHFQISAHSEGLRERITNIVCRWDRTGRISCGCFLFLHYAPPLLPPCYSRTGIGKEHRHGRGLSMASPPDDKEAELWTNSWGQAVCFVFLHTLDHTVLRAGHAQELCRALGLASARRCQASSTTHRAVYYNCEDVSYVQVKRRHATKTAHTFHP